MGNGFILEMLGISKKFPGVQALESVDFAVRQGEVHSLMGENGAGKSTLIKILTGIYTKDTGKILFSGQEIHPATASDAQKLGISTIYQELNLIPYLSVSENIFIGREPKKGPFINWRDVEEKTRKILDEMGLGISIDVKQPLFAQSVAIQQMVAIARAISVEAKLLVMDEPTSSLNEKEVQLLFKVIRELKSRGISIIFISHKLDEIFDICDSVTILKDGLLVGDYNVRKLTTIELVSKMIGRDASSVLTKKKEYSSDLKDNEILCAVRNISKGKKPNNVSLYIRRGEVVGIAGLLGSGRTEVARILFGDDIPDTGEIEVNGDSVIFKNPANAIDAGIALCPEDRKEEGIVPYMTIADNITLPILRQIGKFGFKSKRRQLKIAEEYIDKLGVKTPSALQKIRNLSGGNQQKVLLAKWLSRNSDLMILDEPTRGIDVGAKAEVEAIIQELAAGGISVLMISSEMDELIRNCDRICVMRDGEKIGELEGELISEENIMDIIAHAN